MAQFPDVGREGVARLVLTRQVLCPDLIGRAQELGVLIAALDGVRAGRGRMVLLLGEAGIGKSRLARETMAEARRRGFSVLAGRSSDGRAAVAYRPLAAALL